MDTQREQVIARLLEHGEIDNFWCIDTRLTIRLGAIIHTLRQDGWGIDGMFGKKRGPQYPAKNFYYLLRKAPKVTTI